MTVLESATIHGLKSVLLLGLAATSAALPSPVPDDSLPNTSSVINLNITASNITHTIQANHTITTVAAHYGPGECDLARLNLLSDPGFIYAGEVLRTLVRATFPDDYSYFSANNTQTKNTCIYGGPREQSVVFQVGMQIEGCMIRFNHRKFARRLYVCTSGGRLPET